MDFLQWVGSWMYTDWSETSTRYFWWRGALWGFLLATFVWNLAWPWLKAKATGSGKEIDDA